MKLPFGEYESFDDCVAKNQDKDDPEAYCATIKRLIEGGDKPRKISFDTTSLDNKILVDDDDYLVMPAVIASEIVHQYEDGWAYKPADELEKMTATAIDISSVPIKILEHPGPETNYLLVRRSDVYGRAENFQFVKNLQDPKTGRPMRRGVKADIRWFKNRTPADIIEKIKVGILHDVSIGFTFDADPTQGEFNGVHYDYVQRNIFLNHIAAPIEQGRCPGPVCGIGFDKSDKEKDCPICQAIEKTGIKIASARLSRTFGKDKILTVILNSKTPQRRATIDEELLEAFSQLKNTLERGEQI